MKRPIKEEIKAFVRRSEEDYRRQILRGMCQGCYKWRVLGKGFLCEECRDEYRSRQFAGSNTGTISI